MARLLSYTVGNASQSLSSTRPWWSGTHRTRTRSPHQGSPGERSKEIAGHLGITERTVKAHLGSIYLKLDVDSRAAAVAVAIERGILLQRGKAMRDHP